MLLAAAQHGVQHHGTLPELPCQQVPGGGMIQGAHTGSMVQHAEGLAARCNGSSTRTYKSADDFPWRHHLSWDVYLMDVSTHIHPSRVLAFGGITARDMCFPLG